MPNTPDGPDRYCPSCGWFPEDADDDETAEIGFRCPSCGIGPIVASAPAAPKKDA